MRQILIMTPGLMNGGRLNSRHLGNTQARLREVLGRYPIGEVLARKTPFACLETANETSLIAKVGYPQEVILMGPEADALTRWRGKVVTRAIRVSDQEHKSVLIMMKRAFMAEVVNGAEPGEITLLVCPGAIAQAILEAVGIRGSFNEMSKPLAGVLIQVEEHYAQIERVLPTTDT